MRRSRVAKPPHDVAKQADTSGESIGRNFPTYPPPPGKAKPADTGYTAASRPPAVVDRPGTTESSRVIRLGLAGTNTGPVLGMDHLSLDPALPPSVFEVTIYLSDASVHEQVEAAVEDLLASVGARIEHHDDPIIGSWFRRMRAKIVNAAESPASREAMVLAAHATENYLVHNQDANVTAKMMENLAPVLTSIQPYQEAAIRVGALLIVKVDGAVMVHQLTPRQQFELNHHPELAQAPRRILTALQLGDGNVVEAQRESFMALLVPRRRFPSRGIWTTLGSCDH